MALDLVNNPTHLISGSANIRGSASSILSRADKDPSSISLNGLKSLNVLYFTSLLYLIFLCLQVMAVCNKINGPLND